MDEKTMALAEILTIAKFNVEFADTDHERKRWQRVVDITFVALGRPTIAQLDQWKEHGQQQGRLFRP